MNTMTEKRFTLQMDTEWWIVGDNTIKVNENGYREDLTGEDRYRGLKQDLTEQEVVDLLNEQDQKIKELEHDLSELHLEKGSAEYYKQLAEEYFEEISKLTYKLNKIKDDIER